MKHVFLGVVGILASCCLVSSCFSEKSEPTWKLVWTENFDGPTLDETVWTRIPRGVSDWNNYMSLSDSCFDFRNGNLVLRGKRNYTEKNDTAPYLTGGVFTKGKKLFDGGRIEICAKLMGGKGEWPAMWMLPDKGKWPYGGEIDIMERLNHDDFAYQTVHSYYTKKVNDTIPMHYATHPIKPNDYNIFSVDIYPDSLVFAINHEHSFTYPRIEKAGKDQFPFYQPYYLLIDMQLGGTWVGAVDPDELPVEMLVDWVKYYKKE